MTTKTPATDQDEELEKFINEAVFDTGLNGIHLHTYVTMAKDACEKVAAFASRRASEAKEEEMRRYMEQKVKEAKQVAREKAIEECARALTAQADAQDGAYGTTVPGLQLRVMADILLAKKSL